MDTLNSDCVPESGARSAELNSSNRSLVSCGTVSTSAIFNSLGRRGLGCLTRFSRRNRSWRSSSSRGNGGNKSSIVPNVSAGSNVSGSLGLGRASSFPFGLRSGRAGSPCRCCDRHGNRRPSHNHRSAALGQTLQGNRPGWSIALRISEGPPAATAKRRWQSFAALRCEEHESSKAIRSSEQPQNTDFGVFWIGSNWTAILL